MADLIKYFGFELGAQTNIDPKDDRWIINGAHEASKLQDHLDGFINKFVLCGACKNPETVVNIKDGLISLDCKACGARTDVNLRYKLSGYILKEQPKKGKKDKSTKKADRKARKEAERNGEVDASANPSPGDSASDDGEYNGNGDADGDAGSDDELTRRINAEAKNLDAAELDEEEAAFTVDTSEAAVKARLENLPDDLRRTAITEDDEDGEGGGPYDELGKWISETAEKQGGVAAVDDIEIYRKAKELGIEAKRKTLIVLAQTLFDENMLKQIDKRASLLKQIIADEPRSEKAFMGGFERFVGIEKPELIPQVSGILVKIYNEEIVSEETLKNFCSKASKKYVDIATSKKVRKSAEKFAIWLENAESEDESDSE